MPPIDSPWQIVVEEIEFAESKGSSETTQAAEPGQADNNGFMNIPTGLEEELPFN